MRVTVRTERRVRKVTILSWKRVKWTMNRVRLTSKKRRVRPGTTSSRELMEESEVDDEQGEIDEQEEESAPRDDIVA